MLSILPNVSYLLVIEVLDATFKHVSYVNTAIVAKLMGLKTI